MQISDAQSRAIAHGTGPAIVLAGPGSGKTLVITQRTKYLIESCHVNPHEILVITFTKAAAEEMRQRFQMICGAAGVTFGTFHAVFFGILKIAYHFSASSILSEDKKYQIIQQLVHSMKLEPEEEKEMINDLIAEISLVKNEQIDLTHYYSKSCSEDYFRFIFQQYEKIHREMGVLDFDDMMVYTYDLLIKRPDILAGWQKKFSYILVDEFQDINLLQYKILQLLALPGNNLFIVGDDDQSIYRFRGARPEFMLNFRKEYPTAKTILLDHNFRSTPQIVQGAFDVIQDNQNRYEKNIKTVREVGESIDIQEFQNQEHESLFLVKQIRDSLKEGRSPSQIAVLFRTNQGARPYAQRLMEFNLPFEMRDTLPDIYEHWIAKDILAYLSLAFHGLSRSEFLRVMNHPARYISRESISNGIVVFDNLKRYYADKDWMVDRIDRMEFDLKLMRQMNPFAAINYIRKGIHYEDYLQEYAKNRHIDEKELFDLLDEIHQSSKPFQDIESWLSHIEKFHEKILESRLHKKEHNEDAVIFATLHSAKGLEFEEVYLLDINEGIIPHQKVKTEADMEEERRLFYVGMTRAKDILHIWYMKERYGKRMDPSRFLDRFLEL